jgi:4-hydroxy-tetrahydrodipicolinate synthase
MKFGGIYTPAVTPHREDGEIDRDGFVAVIENLVSSGVHGRVIGGPTGEYYAQSLDERAELVALARETIRSRGTGALRQSGSIFLAKGPPGLERTRF